MDSLYNYLINKTLKSEYFKAWVLAQVRHMITAGGTYLVVHGLASNDMVQDLLGFAITSASFYLAALDVKLVDGKIKVALNTVPPIVTDPVVPVEVHVLPDIETKK